MASHAGELSTHQGPAVRVTSLYRSFNEAGGVLNGLDLDYIYYKQPSEFTTGTSVTEMADPFFIVHRMLANQFRAARNPCICVTVTLPSSPDPGV